MGKETPSYPEIPDKRRFTIGEVCKLCLVQRHTLRYWEKLYTQLGKISRHNNRRYYTTADIFTIRTINKLKQEGLTSQGIAKALNSNASKHAAQSHMFEATKIRTELENIVKLLE